MIPTIEAYQRFVGPDCIHRIRGLAEKLEDKRIVHMNSTYSGGGVAEMLHSIVVLMNTLDIDTSWRLLKGTHSFFYVTKKMHNALQGSDITLSDREKRIYIDEIERNGIMHHFKAHDMVFIHDPQPLGLIQYIRKKRKDQKWIWRCHIQMAHANRQVWDFLLPFAMQYDGAIFSLERYKRQELKMPQYVISPSIDPLSLKNRYLSENNCRRILSRESIDMDKPIITQVSRFDKWKNPLGVLRIFRTVKQKVDSRLVLIGDMATDDPEGPRIYNKTIRQAEDMKDVHVITKKDDILVNALQTASHIVLQNSIREGFGLTVSEALWKETPVIATKTGGIPLQVLHKKTGVLINNDVEAAEWCVKLLNDDRMRIKLGVQGKEHIRNNFLITRHVLDYLNLIDSYTAKKRVDVRSAAHYLRKLLLR